MSTAGALDGPAEVLRRHPELVVIVDHLGLRQNPTFGLDSPPMRDLPRLLELAEHPNIRVKLSGVPTLSGTAYPFEDLWEGLDQVIDAFGAERLMWGSDISRVMGRAGSVQLAPPGLEYARHTYARRSSTCSTPTGSAPSRRTGCSAARPQPCSAGARSRSARCTGPSARASRAIPRHGSPPSASRSRDRGDRSSPADRARLVQLVPLAAAWPPARSGSARGAYGAIACWP